jgi:maleamate amidohydrolase
MPDAHARATYERAGIGGRLPAGRRPAVLVVDLCLGFTDTRCSLGADLDAEVEATARLLAAARGRGVAVVFTTIAYDDGELERLLWARKMPALAELGPGSPWTQLDPRLDRQPDEPVIVKQGASAFFGTQLASVLVSAGVDSVVLCGASTSGCVRATAIDLMQYGWAAIVPRECVGDRAPAPGEANLFDIDAKYGDVVSLGEALQYMAAHA